MEMMREVNHTTKSMQCIEQDLAQRIRSLELVRALPTLQKNIKIDVIITKEKE